MSDQNELSAEARALLSEARGGDDPAPSDRARVRRALMATIAGGAGLAASSAASSAAASTTAAASSAAVSATAATGLSLTAKIAAVVLVVGAVSGTVAVAPWEAPETPVRHERAASATRSIDERPAAQRIDERAPGELDELVGADETVTGASEGEADPPDAAPSTAGALPSATEAAIASGEPARAGSVARPTRERRAIAPPRQEVRASAPESDVAREIAVAPAQPSALAEETRVLRSAQSALNAGDHDTALARLAEHARRFPDGAMVEEREAARILALCRAGRREEARTAAARFLRERPRSPLAARVRASCE